MSLFYILAQVMSGIGLILSVQGLQNKDKNKTILIIGFSNIFLCFAYLFLDALAGLLTMIIATVRMFVFYFLEKKQVKRSISLCVLIAFEVAIMLSVLPSWEGALSIINALGFMVYTYGCWQKNMYVFYSSSIFVSSCIILYNIPHAGWTNIILEAVMIIGTIIPLIKYILRDKKKTCEIGASCQTKFAYENNTTATYCKTKWSFDSNFIGANCQTKFATK